MSAPAVNPASMFAQEIRAESDAQRRRALEALPLEALAQIAAVPEWSFALARNARLESDIFALGSLLDSLMLDGWCENRALFVPGECSIVFDDRPANLSLVRSPGTLQYLKMVGLVPAESALPEYSEREDVRERSIVEQLSLPTGQLLCRMRAITWRSMVACPPGKGARITLAPFNSDHPPLELEGAVFSSSGEKWFGYEMVVVLDEPSQGKFCTALYHEFSVPMPRRAELIALAEVNWMRICATVAERIWRVHLEEGIAIVGPTRRWAQLARRLGHGLDYVARRVIRRVEALLRRNLAGEVIGLLDAATLLAQTVGGNLVSAVGICQRRLELHYRRQVDARRLDHFYERREQRAPFDQVMKPDSPQWALHYLGTAGVGKTMLLRFLNRELLERKHAVARIDFDYLGADFPVRRPAQLLVELADSLQLHIRDANTEGAFREFRDRADYIHREVNAEPPPNDPLGNLHRHEFDAVLTAFCDFLSGLPQPVVLFLDTCEELARLQPDGRFQPGVQATFEILERIQKRLRASSARMRVIFAGRRLLAIGGAGWRSKGSELEERRRQFSEREDADSEPKDFLLLHEIRGFDEEEAAKYLGRRLEPTRPGERFGAEHPLVKAILGKSRDNTRVCDFEWLDGRAAESGDRFNPFSLSLYADWAAEDPKLEAVTIALGGTDPYVEIRVIRRIEIHQPDVLTVLPTLLLLRRVDKSWLGEIFGFGGEALENLYHELCQTEWMDYQPRDGVSAWLEVDRNLRPRLERLYEMPKRAPKLEAARARLAEWVSQRLHAPPKPEETKPEETFVSAALRLLTTVEAAAYWRELETRIANTDEWHWAAQVCDHLLGTKETVGVELETVGVELQASVKATLAAARLHTQSFPDVLHLWQQVTEAAAKNPIREQAQWLADRAAAGALAAKLRRGEGPVEEELSAFWRMVAERPSANWGGTIEAMLNFSDATGRDLIRFEAMPDWRYRCSFSEQVKGVVAAMSFVVEFKRYATVSGAPVELEHILAAANAKAKAEPASARVEMPDWTLPLRLHERLRLEYLQCSALSPRDALRPDGLLLDQWRDEAVENLSLPDSPWLIAQILHDHPPTDRTQLQVLTDKVGDLPQVPPKTWAQRRTLPLFVSLAKAWNDAGDAEQALRLLDGRLGSGKLDAAATSQAQRAKAEIIHQHGLVERAQVFLNALRTAPTKPDQEALRLLEEIVVGKASPHAGRPRTNVINMVIGLGGLGVAALVLWFVFEFALWVFGRYSEGLTVIIGAPVGFGLRLGTFVLLLAITGYLIAVMPRLSRRFRDWLNHLCESATVAHLRMCSAGTDSGVDTRMVAISLAQLRMPRESRKRLRAFLRGCAKALPVLLLRGIPKSFLAFREALLSESAQMETAWRAELYEMGTRLSPQSSAESDEVIAELRAMVAGSGPRPFALALAPEVSLAHFGWEDGLARLLAADGGKPPENFAPFRALPPVDDEGTHPWRAYDGDKVRTLIVSHWTSPFRIAWWQGTRRARFAARFALPFNHSTPTAAAAIPNFRICHLVGETIRSSAGVRFRTSSSVSSELTEIAPPSDNEDRSAEQLLLEEAGLFIVQEIPETSGLRSQTDRERTANMRRFANELFQGGAWAVLFIPNLPSALAVQIIERIGRAMHRRRSPSLHELIELSRTVRAEVAAASDYGTTEFLSELAWEVTLFARSRAHVSLASKQKTDAPGQGSGPAPTHPLIPMALWDTISSWFTENANHLQYLTFLDPNAPAAVAKIKPQEHYFRLWLCEMFLTKSRDWFSARYPAVNAQVRLKFANRENQPFTRVAAPPQDQLGRGVYQNYALTELLPFHGGTVEIQAGLLDLKGENSLISGIKVLQSFSQLVSAPLGQVLTLAEQVTAGVEKLFTSADGQVHLGFHQTFAATGGGGTHDLEPGYVAVIAATAAQLPPSQLKVEDGRLNRNGAPLEGFDYMLFRIEGRALRDDTPSNIEEPFQEAQASYENGDLEKAKAFREAAIAAAFRSQDLTKTDRRRVIDGIKKELQSEADAAAAGHGLSPSERLTLADAVARHAKQPSELAHLPEISSAEAFGE